LLRVGQAKLGRVLLAALPHRDSVEDERRDHGRSIDLDGVLLVDQLTQDLEGADQRAFIEFWLGLDDAFSCRAAAWAGWPLPASHARNSRLAATDPSTVA